MAGVHQHQPGQRHLGNPQGQAGGHAPQQPVRLPASGRLVVGTSTTDHNLAVAVYGDERSSADQTRTYPRTTTSLTGPERVELRVRRQLCGVWR